MQDLIPKIAALKCIIVPGERFALGDGSTDSYQELAGWKKASNPKLREDQRREQVPKCDVVGRRATDCTSAAKRRMIVESPQSRKLAQRCFCWNAGGSVKGGLMARMRSTTGRQVQVQGAPHMHMAQT